MTSWMRNTISKLYNAISGPVAATRDALAERLRSYVKPRHFISLMDVAQNLMFITSYYIYFKLLMILFSF